MPSKDKGVVLGVQCTKCEEWFHEDFTYAGVCRNCDDWWPDYPKKPVTSFWKQLLGRFRRPS